MVVFLPRFIELHRGRDPRVPLLNFTVGPSGCRLLFPDRV